MMQYDIEKMINKSLPQALVQFLDKFKVFYTEIDGILEEFHSLEINEMLVHYEEQRDIFCYDIIPFAMTDDDYLCLNYKDNEIAVVYWSSERAMESRKMAVFEIYNTLTDFYAKSITIKPSLDD